MTQPDELHVAPRFSLPVDIVTDTIAFLSRKGGGKTYSAGVLVEEMLEISAQVVILDPVSKWWALRLAADGKTPAYDIPVFGGNHGDIPLSPVAGNLIADLVVDFGSSLVLDLGGFGTLGEQRRFVTDFVTQLLLRKRQQNSPMHVVFEEAQEFVPQRVATDETRMVSAVQRLIKLGRNFGVGATLISQRAASVNKDALTQTEVLCALQTTSPQDRDAIRAWIDHAGADVAKNIVDSLPKLQQGEMHMWSPGRGLYKQVKFRKKRTFDSTATPKVGEKRVPPKELTKLDLAKIETAMASVVEQAKRNDPKELHREIIRLQGELQRQTAVTTVVEKERVVERVVEVPALAESDEHTLYKILGELRQVASDVEIKLDGAKLEAARTREFAALASTERPELRPGETTTAPKTFFLNEHHEVPQRKKPHLNITIATTGKLRKGAINMLMTIANANRTGIARDQLWMLAGAGMKVPTFETYLADLRRCGAATEDGGRWYVATTGLNILGEFDWVPEPPGNRAAHVEMWCKRLRAGAAEMLRLIVAAYPKTVSREWLEGKVNGQMKRATFDTYLADLRRCLLIETSDDRIVASAYLGELPN